MYLEPLRYHSAIPASDIAIRATRHWMRVPRKHLSHCRLAHISKFVNSFLYFSSFPSSFCWKQHATSYQRANQVVSYNLALHITCIKQKTYIHDCKFTRFNPFPSWQVSALAIMRHRRGTSALRTEALRWVDWSLLQAYPISSKHRTYILQNTHLHCLPATFVTLVDSFCKATHKNITRVAITQLMASHQSTLCNNMKCKFQCYQLQTLAMVVSTSHRCKHFFLGNNFPSRTDDLLYILYGFLSANF